LGKLGSDPGRDARRYQPASRRHRETWTISAGYVEQTFGEPAQPIDGLGVI